ncbi:hypothetical protein BOW53_04280 [Solemya pervernicosa gill symbiont]|uniref:Pilus assembly protein PilW n=2 Tax=Gammaproteobacteria incertae sedis TaxID=118884 RepID=A0A1T2L8B1_9GAMM|nr:PilW family protein [Candidatus Reidiella endopervernicosa]OOZ41339.1 hypothetical protein BOW53_04280 [Solemya pervernicosa gill symbiont]QKQ27718.1 PilW family protein [Candidatus Reidiella endopervernicosa]
MNISLSQPGNERGLTLVELMVALALSMILLAGTIQIFVSSKQVYRVQDASSEVQQSGRFASIFINRDMRMAGFFGCAGMAGVTFTNNVNYSRYVARSGRSVPSDIVNFDGTGSLIGYDNVGSITSTSNSALYNLGLRIGTATGEVILGTDVISMSGAASCPGGEVVSPYNSGSNIKIADADTCGIDQYDIVIVTNCTNADIFGVTNNPSGNGNSSNLAYGANINGPTGGTSHKIEHEYGEGAKVLGYRSVTYYIGNGSSGGPALYRISSNNGSGMVTEELVEGIESINFEYGQDSDDDGSANFFVAAGAITDWEQVVAIRPTLVSRSSDTNITETGDTRLRHSFRSTITVRNRL